MESIRPRASFRVRAALAAGLAVAIALRAGPAAAAQEPIRAAIITDGDPGRAARHGIGELEAALAAKGVASARSTRVEDASGDLVVVVGVAGDGGPAASVLREWGLECPSAPESLLVHRAVRRGRTTLVVSGADDRGLMYALLDVADRIGWAASSTDVLSEVRDTVESPAVSERAVSIYAMQRRYFESRLFDEAYWASYMDMLARNRFNRFVVVFGYENGGYFAPAYPYFFDVEGFPDVRVVGFTPELQSRYLEAFRRMIRTAHDRGIEVTAGLWDHIYRGGVQTGGVRGVDPGQSVPGVPRGLTKRNLLAYSTAALREFLERLPELDAVQFRMHGESGLRPGEEMREFWRSIFHVVKDVRPDLRFDARAKEFPDELIDLALEMGVRIRISTKYWAEQMGLPFHPTHINRQNQHDRRHGYADLLRYPRRYAMHWRLWNGGTTRVLLWGSPEFARRFAESTHLYDGEGFEVNEMLATKMEAQPHDLTPFDLLRPEYRSFRWEFERYWHFYQVFGRIGYDPSTPAEVWGREFQRRFGRDAAPFVARALHRASWILPRINASLFPYNRFPTTRGWAARQRWEDLPAYARCEGSDTQQFLSFADAAKERLEGGESARLHPARNSEWFARVSRDVLDDLAEAEMRIDEPNPEFVSTRADLKILASLALYHARRIHAGLHYALFEQTRDLNELDDAIAHEERAIEAWEGLVEAAGDIYTDDLMMGLRRSDLSGHWKDELPALKAGLDALRAERDGFAPAVTSSPWIAHVPVRRATASAPVVARATVRGDAPIESVRLHWSDDTAEARAIDLEAAGPSRYRAPLPRPAAGGAIRYFIEAVDTRGNRSRMPQGGFDQPLVATFSQDADPPLLEHEPIRSARAGEPLVVTALVRDASRIKWVRVLHRGVTQFEDYRATELRPSGAPHEYRCVIPGDEIDARWDFMYLFEVMDEWGNGTIYPDLERETPYIVVKLARE